MKWYAVAEGPDEAALIADVLRQLGLEGGQVIPARGRGGVISLARTLATRPNVRVAAILNADTTNPQRIEEQKTIFEDLVTYLGEESQCRLFQAVPTLDSVLAPHGYVDREALDRSPLSKLRDYLDPEPTHQPQNEFGF